MSSPNRTPDETRLDPLERDILDPYEVLGLPRGAALDEVKQAYFAQVKAHPPERDPRMFKRIRAAYDALRTPEAKAATDLFLLHPPPEQALPDDLPAFDLDFHPEDWLIAARSACDLGRVDFRSDYRDIDL